MVSRGRVRSRLAEFSAAAQLGQHEVQFLQAIVDAMRTTGVLSETALAHRTVSFCVPWADSLLTAHRDNRIHRPHVDKAVKAALIACDRLTAHGVRLQRTQVWKQLLRTIDGSADLTTAPVLGAARHDLNDHLLEIANAILGPHPWSPETVSVMAIEVAQGLISRDADPDEFLSRLGALDIDSPAFRADLADAIIHREEPHPVIVTVNGARFLERLSVIGQGPGLRQIFSVPGQRMPGWGNMATAALDFTRRAIDVDGHDAVICARVTASGARAAAVAGLRAVTEALDHYVAEHPRVDFEISRTIGVGVPGARRLTLVSLDAPSVDLVKPLPGSLPAQLREALRMFHLLRKQSSPMTRVALAWVSLEAAGVSRKSDAVAKILALSFLRQRAFNSYRLMVQDALDVSRERVCRRRASILRGQARKRRLYASGPNVPADGVVRLESQALKYDMLAAMFARLEDLHGEQNAVRRSLLLDVETSIQQPVANPSRNRARLNSIDDWVRLLNDYRRSTGTAAATALDQLLTAGSVSTKAAVDRFGVGVHTSAVGAQELSVDYKWSRTLLATMNTARNLHLHSGTYTAEGDFGLGRLAVLVPDLLFEVWSSWYRTGASLSPDQIIDKLAARYDRCLAELKRGATLADADFDNLTAESWAPRF